jgi:hypothetical protein
MRLTVSLFFTLALALSTKACAFPNTLEATSFMRLTAASFNICHDLKERDGSNMVMFQRRQWKDIPQNRKINEFNHVNWNGKFGRKYAANSLILASSNQPYSHGT